jgi:hypothetical protein
VVFSFALLFVVVMVFGNEGSGGVDEGAGASGSQRLGSPSSSSSGESRPHNVALALGKAKRSNPWSANGQSAAGPPEAPPPVSSDEAPAPSSDAIQIHD